MASDWIFVIGCLMVLVAISRLIGSWVEQYVSIPALVAMAVGAGMIAWAVLSHPGVYAPDVAPDAFIRVIGYVLQGNAPAS